VNDSSTLPASRHSLIPAPTNVDTVRNNAHLVSKYKRAGSPKQSWTEFIAEASQDNIEVFEIDETSMDDLSTESSVKESVVEDETQQHHSKETLSTRAINQDWLQMADFESLGERVADLTDALAEIIEDPRDSVFFRLFTTLVQDIGVNRAIGIAGGLEFGKRYGRGTG